MKYNLEVLLKDNTNFTAFLHTKIKAFNDEKSNHHKDARKEGAVQPISIIVSNDINRWIGGITAEVYWNWLELNDFWFDETYRGDGLGSTLLEKVEAIAKQKGAEKAMVTTFEFQAKTFYELKGYQVVGAVEDYPPGSCYYTMVKTLS
ncbi:GNAT family N-acetyltransferase [Virgibacillus phasianinus]|uniref:GNAT family N-acetyltransferase n=1 Tax=Virgibacillus phasianinus TaxID=2017483 RepID=A0A220U6X9_9BACI|nr:GNAT family N-acetyltransferase [Virgibacillus phasianinus]ASK63850.1 GNAT family N-acetyltransferase [Virgibacillus phasianinus]